MTEAILAFFSGLPDWLYVLVISMLPIVELRGAIPVGAGLGMEYFLCYPLAVIGNMIPVPFILLFIPHILDFMSRFKLFRPIVSWLRKKANKHSKRVLKDTADSDRSVEVYPEATSDSADNTGSAENASQPAQHSEADIESALKNETHPATYIKNPSASQEKRAVTRPLFIALLLFVAIPLPGTGAWTGGLVSSLFNFERGKSALAILLGVLISGVVMSLISYGVLGFLSFLI